MQNLADALSHAKDAFDSIEKLILNRTTCSLSFLLNQKAHSVHIGNQQIHKEARSTTSFQYVQMGTLQMPFNEFTSDENRIRLAIENDRESHQATAESTGIKDSPYLTDCRNDLTTSNDSDVIENIDWREVVEMDGWPVQNQFHTASCVGFAVADGLLNFYINLWQKSGIPEYQSLSDLKDELTSNKIRIERHFSARKIWTYLKSVSFDNNPNKTYDDLSGVNTIAWRYALLKMLDHAFLPLDEQRLGVVEYSPLEYPYCTRWNYSNIFEFTHQKGRPIHIISTLGRDYNTAKEVITYIKRMLSKNGPLALEMRVSNHFRRFTSKDDLAIYTPNNEDRIIDHAVTAIGFNDNGIIIKNSWGETWGSLGYCVLNEKSFDPPEKTLHQIITINK